MSAVPRLLSVADIAGLSQRRGVHELWVNDVGSVTWAEFGIAVESARKECVGTGVRPGSVVEIIAEERLGFLAWVFGAAAAGAVIAPIRWEVLHDSPLHKLVEIEWRVVDGRLEQVEIGSAAPASLLLLRVLRSRGKPGLILATAGRGGGPKIVLHDLSALLATVPVRDGRPWRVLPLMRFDTFGGLDAAWRAVGGRQVLVAPPANVTPERVAALIERHKVEVLSAIPSFLELLLVTEAHRARDLRSLQIVAYGGEPMTMPLLDSLKRALPHVEFVPRFGTCETGSLPVRGAGSGLMLNDKKDGFSWKVVDHELWLRSPAMALGYLSGNGAALDSQDWFRTGDTAEAQPDGSVRILGRISEPLNASRAGRPRRGAEGPALSSPLTADSRTGSPTGVLSRALHPSGDSWRDPDPATRSVDNDLPQPERKVAVQNPPPRAAPLVKSGSTAPMSARPRKLQP